MYDYEERHRKVTLPCVRIISEDVGGSGTVIYSQDGSTYVLTNHHVIKNSIQIEERWSSLLKSERKIDTFKSVQSHFFDYQWESREVGGTSIQSDIKAYDKDEDLALLKLRIDREIENVAELFPHEGEKNLRIGMKVIAVGAAMREPPVQTEGLLSQFGQEIDRREYWLNTAPTIFGNSGGALFLKDTYQLIGVPSRIKVFMSGFSMDPITHLSYAIPITRIYQFLDDQKFRFIYDDDFTEDGEAELRRQIREDEERKMAMGSMQ